MPTFIHNPSQLTTQKEGEKWVWLCDEKKYIKKYPHKSTGIL